MTIISKTKQALSENDSSKKLAILVISIGLTTWIHHVYGGLVYDTMYRIVAPSILLPLFWVTTFYLQFRLIKQPAKILKTIFTLFISIVWIIPIGLIEGGYNHIIKNILHLIGISKDKLSNLFPPEFGAIRLFEEPNDIFFEFTGIIQFFIGLLIIFYLRLFLKTIK